MLIRFFYKFFFRPVLFMQDPEFVHNRFLRLGNFIGRYKLGRKSIKALFYYSDKSLEQNILGIKFSNPIGLAAGFDKNAQLVDILPSVGFGFMEVGSITGEPCKGNSKPRLWRLKKSKGLVVYYGLMNDGCEKIFRRLKERKFSIPLGVSIAKTNNENTAQTEAGIADYVKAHKTLINVGDYVTINISCPNSFGGEPFTDPEKLDKLLEALNETPKKKPILLKLPPDLSRDVVDRIIDIAKERKIDGFICVNLTKRRDNLNNLKDAIIPDVGGISGKPVEDLSNSLIKYIYKKAGKEFVIIGCGGVFNAQDAYKKIKLGASLVQLITGMIYEGPQLIGEINKGLVWFLKKDGFTNISQAIGSDNK